MNLFKRIALYLLLFSFIVPPAHIYAGRGGGAALVAAAPAATLAVVKGGSLLATYLTAGGLTIALGPVGLAIAGGVTVAGFAGLIAHNKKKSQGNSTPVVEAPSKGGGGGSFGGNGDPEDEKNRKFWEDGLKYQAEKDKFNAARKIADEAIPATPVRPAPECPPAKPTPANSTETVLGSSPDLRTGINKALEILGPQDKAGSLPLVGKLGATKDLIAGRYWFTNGTRSTMRLDWAPKQGLHINVEGFNHAKQQAINGIIQIPGNAQTLSNYLKHLNTPASMATAISSLKLAAVTAKSGAQYAANMATRLSASAALKAKEHQQLFNAAAQTARWLAHVVIGF
jgi:hypothetical protein